MDVGCVLGLEGITGSRGWRSALRAVAHSLHHLRGVFEGVEGRIEPIA